MYSHAIIHWRNEKEQKRESIRKRERDTHREERERKTIKPNKNNHRSKKNKRKLGKSWSPRLSIDTITSVSSIWAPMQWF